jgi:hypothetical protein
METYCRPNGEGSQEERNERASPLMVQARAARALPQENGRTSHQAATHPPSRGVAAHPSAGPPSAVPEDSGNVVVEDEPYRGLAPAFDASAGLAAAVRNTAGCGLPSSSSSLACTRAKKQRRPKWASAPSTRRYCDDAALVRRVIPHPVAHFQCNQKEEKDGNERGSRHDDEPVEALLTNELAAEPIGQ